MLSRRVRDEVEPHPASANLDLGRVRATPKPYKYYSTIPSLFEGHSQDHYPERYSGEAWSVLVKRASAVLLPSRFQSTRWWSRTPSKNAKPESTHRSYHYERPSKHTTEGIKPSKMKGELDQLKVQSTRSREFNNKQI